MKRMNKELKENIMQGTLQAFNQKGLKFTMDDIAKILGISKKTIYQVFRDKEALFLETVDYLFQELVHLYNIEVLLLYHLSLDEE